jgi:hypothetical protein
VPGDLQWQAIPLEQRGIDVDRDAADVGYGSVLRSTGDNNTVAQADWLRHGGGMLSRVGQYSPGKG